MLNGIDVFTLVAVSNDYGDAKALLDTRHALPIVHLHKTITGQMLFALWKECVNKSNLNWDGKSSWLGCDRRQVR